VTKSELRKTVRLRLNALPPESRTKKSAAICRAAAATSEWQRARTVGFFSPLASEPNVDLLWAVLETRAVCYPRIQDKELVFIRVPDRSALLESRWNLLEPLHNAECVEPLHSIDLLLVPGLAFTADGHRLGRGGGFYDRLLSNRTARLDTFGICFSEQLMPHLPTEAHDQRVGRVFSA
jgi:5-formyltetrahydrofolate cyclo-ligase